MFEKIKQNKARKNEIIRNRVGEFLEENETILYDETSFLDSIFTTDRRILILMAYGKEEDCHIQDTSYYYKDILSVKKNKNFLEFEVRDINNKKNVKRTISYKSSQVDTVRDMIEKNILERNTATLVNRNQTEVHSSALNTIIENETEIKDSLKDLTKKEIAIHNALRNKVDDYLIGFEVILTEGRFVHISYFVTDKRIIAMTALNVKLKRTTIDSYYYRNISDITYTDGVCKKPNYDSISISFKGTIKNIVIMLPPKVTRKMYNIISEYISNSEY